MIHSIFVFKVNHVTPESDEESTCKLKGNLKINLKISGIVNRKDKEPQKTKNELTEKNKRNI